MNIKRIGILLIIVLFVFGCKPEEEPENEKPPVIPPDTRKVVLLTVGDSKDITTLLNEEMSDKTITWSSGSSSKVSVTSGGIVTATITGFSDAEGGNKKYTDGPARAEIIITAKALDNTTQEFRVIATTEAQVEIMDLPPLKDRFPSTILVGNILTGSSINGTLSRHFNAFTSENNMKPSMISNGRNGSTGVISYTWSSADSFVNAVNNAGFKVIGHTLLWHNQIPTWQVNMKDATKATALAAMKTYITDVVTHFKGKIYSWDVLNEAFPDGSSGNWKDKIRTQNPWFKAIGSDFVYEGFLAAREADPDAILYYNDYNTNDTNRATLIRNMVKDVNDKYLTSSDKPDGEDPNRLLIEGIGMQEHHNTGVSATSIRTTLNLFKPLGVKVSVSELDVLGQGWGDFKTGDGTDKHTQSTVTNNGLLKQADLYQQYMAVYKDFMDIIERISFWGVTDNQSWRSGGLPLLFDANSKAKPAYYKFVGAIPTTW
jgi:endo-1,4-beta-xylanase